jgi:predicted nucleotidyltransferase
MTTVTIDPRLRDIATKQPHRLLFATVSGAHLYGFPSSDSDWDLRGVHLLPPERVVGLEEGPDTLSVSEMRDDLELDLVTHDVKKFFGLMLRRNGYVLEQLFSPLVVLTTPEHAELKAIAHGCVTRHHSHHYLGFAQTQWELFEKESPRRVKPLLYVYRVLLTGIHLMRTGEIEANLPRLNELAGLRYIPDLVARKVAGPEAATLPEADVTFHQTEIDRLRGELNEASEASHLAEEPSARAALNDLLVRIRLARS